MKKLVVFLVSIFACFIATSCDNVEKTAFEKFNENMSAETANYEMEMSITVSGYIFEMTQKVDKNVIYTPEFMGSSETYREIVGDTIYVYTKANGKWTKEIEIEDEGILGDLNTDVTDFNADEFTFEDGKYSLSEAACNTYGFKTAVMVIDEDCKGATFNITAEVEIMPGMKMTAELMIKIKNYGNVSITLPTIEEAA